MRRAIATAMLSTITSGLLLVVALGAGACSSSAERAPAAAEGAPNAEGAPPAMAQSADPLMDFTGGWSGTSTSNNSAKVRITFDIHRKGNRFEGSYRCKPLNAVCRNNIHQGWVSGNTDARGFRVEMEDTSWCTFMLENFHPPEGDGEYTCYLSGSIVDQGVFRIKRWAATPYGVPG